MVAPRAVVVGLPGDKRARYLDAPVRAERSPVERRCHAARATAAFTVVSAVAAKVERDKERGSGCDARTVQPHHHGHCAAAVPNGEQGRAAVATFAAAAAAAVAVAGAVRKAPGDNTEAGRGAGRHEVRARRCQRHVREVHRVDAAAVAAVASAMTAAVAPAVAPAVAAALAAAVAPGARRQHRKGHVHHSRHVL